MRLRAVVGGIGLAAVAGLSILGAMAPWSPSGWALLAALALGALALSWPRRARRLAAAALALVVAVVGLRLILAGGRRATMTALPAGSTRLLGRVLDEQDASLLGAYLLRAAWRLPRDERDALVPALGRAYAELRAELGVTPSPVLDTFLARQAPSAFDAIVIEPRAARPRDGLVFLHGYGGSFMLECWLLARAADAIGAVTVCPATGFTGHWTGAGGEATVRASIDMLHARGVDRIFLAGLSNGAAGAGVLGPRFAPSLRGLILISGAPSSGSARLPMLVVQGERDTVASASSARAFAARSRASYAGFDGGHFVLLIRRDEVRDTIAAWLRRH